MQIKKTITFSFLNKHRLWFSPAAVTLPSSTTSLEIIKDVIKHHQSRTAKTEHVSRLWHFNGERRRALGYLHKHTRALTSCFLPSGERSCKQSDSGDASGLLDGPQGGMLKQDAAAASSAHWKSGTMNCTIGGPTLFLLSSYMEWVRLRHTRKTLVIHFDL